METLFNKILEGQTKSIMVFLKVAYSSILIIFWSKTAFVGHFFIRAVKLFSARFIAFADVFLDHIRNIRYMN